MTPVDISCVQSPSGCGLWTLLYLFQIGLAGLLAIAAGLLIYAAARRHADAVKGAAEMTIAHEREMRRLDRDDMLGRNQSATMHLVTELRFDAEALRYVVQLTHLQLEEVIQLRRRGRLGNIPAFKARLEKLAAALIRSNDRLSLLPWQMSTPASHLVAWLDDLVVRCRNIDVIFNQKDGRLDLDSWAAEFSYILAGFDDFDEAALAFVSFQTSPAAAFRRYTERYRAVQRDAALKQQAAGAPPHVMAAVSHEASVRVAPGDVEGVPQVRNPFRHMRRTLEPPSIV
jgi:hypothetical protein